MRHYCRIALGDVARDNEDDDGGAHFTVQGLLKNVIVGVVNLFQQTFSSFYRRSLRQRNVG